MAVCHPIRGQIYCTESRARRMICVVYLLCFLTTLSTPFEWEIRQVLNPEVSGRVLKPGLSLESVPRPAGESERVTYTAPTLYVGCVIRKNVMKKCQLPWRNGLKV